MITDIPTQTEFEEAALNYLHMAWDIGIQLAEELENAFYGIDTDKEISDDYWLAAQPALGNAFTLLQQAQEFQLKGRIAGVSPFLLVSREPREWPRHSDKKDTPFSAFRTIDAADLVKLVNTIASHRIPHDVALFIDEVRQQRNTTVHHGTKGQRFDVSRLFIAVLRTYRDLFGEKHWMKSRSDYLESDRIAVAYSTDHVGDALLGEFETVVDLLKPSETKLLLQYDKKARVYTCPNCMKSAENVSIPFAQLRPNTPEATEVWCPVCDTATPVVRQDCKEPNCKSNVIDLDGTCLVCW